LFGRENDMPSPASAERGSLRQFGPQVNVDAF
jgi:hypothetical protein